MFRNLRNAFISGLIFLLPLIITLVIINFLMVNVGNPSSQLFFWFFDPQEFDSVAIQYIINFASIIVVFIIITSVGFFSKYFFGKLIITFTESIINNLPFINKIYTIAKQIAETFSRQNRAIFQNVILVEYPRRGCYGLGFLTGSLKLKTNQNVELKMFYVFLPTTPNPTSGLLLLLPEDQVTYLNISIAEGIKLIISGGTVSPDNISSIKTSVQ